MGNLLQEFKGTIVHIGETESVGASGFLKRAFVLEVEDGQYPQQLPMQFTKDACAKLDAFTEGMEVAVSVNIRGRSALKKDGSGPVWFLSLEAWKIASNGNAPAEPTPNHYNSPSATKQAPQKPAPQTNQYIPNDFVEGTDDLPF